MLNKLFIFITLSGILVSGCKPDRDDDIQLPSTPGAPEMGVEFVQGDSNRLILRDLSEGSFQRVWAMPGGTPTTSTKAVDTVAYSKAGEYVITLFTSKSDGSGTSSASQKVTILNNATLSCGPKMALLTGDCGPAGKCWTLTTAPGAVKVGPTYDDFSWFTSPADGLQPEQYDDGFCFTFDGQVFQYKNNVATVNPWNGYQAEAYDPGISTFVFLEGTGINNRDQILLPNDQFMGVWDSDNILDVVKLTETELIVRARQRDQSGTPAAEGWFELHFVAQ